MSEASLLVAVPDAPAYSFIVLRFVFTGLVAVALACEGDDATDSDAAVGGDATTNPGRDGGGGSDSAQPGDAMLPPPPDQTCGNGTPEGTEACDDGNLENGDGCSSECGIERPEGSVFNESHDWHGFVFRGPMHPAFSDTEERGTFRIKCSVSHINYDDAIVFPGVQNRAHLHTYFGNTDLDFRTTPENIVASRGSTCLGGPLNLSGYWVPTMLRPRYQRNGDGSFATDGDGNYIRTGEYAIVWPMDSYVLDENGVPMRDGSGNPRETGNLGVDIYYKRSLFDGQEITPMPTGLRMIAGRAGATPRDPQNTEHVHFDCHDDPPADGMFHHPNVPPCRPGIGDGDVPFRVRMTIAFPSCWDGVNLDAEDHKSHMAYVEYITEQELWRCPPSHPVLLPQVSYHVAYPITEENLGPSNLSDDWFLSSDTYEASEGMPGGASAHGDWYMAWDQEVSETFTQFCLNEERKCSNGDLGNGFALTRLEPGRGNSDNLPVINRGAGPMN